MALGLLVAGGVHAAKAVAVRPAVSATTGGAGNIPVSILEDVVAVGVSILAIVIPILFAALAIMATALFIFWLWRRANRANAAR